MTHISSKVDGCGIGSLVHDYALGKNGIVISGAWTEERESTYPINWEWLVLYDDSEFLGADTNDLKVIHESR